MTEQDVQIKDGKIELYRTKLKLSFKFEGTLPVGDELILGDGATVTEFIDVA